MSRVGSEDNFSTKPAPSSMAAPSVVAFSIAESDFDRHSDSVSMRDDNALELEATVTAEPEYPQGIALSSPPAQRVVAGSLDHLSFEVDHPQHSFGHATVKPQQLQMDAHLTQHLCTQAHTNEIGDRELPQRIANFYDSFNESACTENQDLDLSNESDVSPNPAAQEAAYEAAYMQHERARTALTATKVKGLIALLIMVVFWACMYFGLNFKRKNEE